MGRGRVPMQVIQNDKARKITFQKRKNGLMKKAEEFSILCDIDVCLIIHAPEFDDQGLGELVTWPEETKLGRIIQKYNDTTSDRRPKIYDVQEYFKDRMKKVEADISKMHKEKHKIMYPTWDNSFNTFGEEQLRIFVGMLDAKLDACNQRMNMLKRVKGKGIVEPNKVERVTPYLASNPSSHLNFLQNMVSQGNFFPSPMKPISDNKNIAFYPFQLGQSSQSYMLQDGQNCLQLMGKNVMGDFGGQFGAITYEPKIGMLKDEERAENNQNSSLCYYNGNMATMQQPYNVSLENLPYQNSQYGAAFQTLPNLPPVGFQPNAFYETNMLQAQMFNYMDGRK